MSEDIRRGAIEHPLGGRIDSQDAAAAVGDDDAVARRIDDGAHARFARVERRFGALADRDVARRGRRADDPAAGIGDRRDRQPDVEQLSVLGAAERFELLDPIARSEGAENARELAEMRFGNHERDILPDGLRRRVAVHTLGPGVPRQNLAVEIFADDGVVGRLDDRREQANNFVRLVVRVGAHREEARRLTSPGARRASRPDRRAPSAS